jgi:NADPH:quinone reductase-like Zn-dependent oxidoreductase
VQAAFYCRQGPAQEVMSYGEQPLPEPAAGEVRVRLSTSGANPADWKVRKGGLGRSLIAPLIIPHSDGAGAIDAVGEGVPAAGSVNESGSGTANGSDRSAPLLSTSHCRQSRRLPYLRTSAIRRVLVSAYPL